MSKKHEEVGLGLMKTEMDHESVGLDNLYHYAVDLDTETSDKS